MTIGPVKVDDVAIDAVATVRTITTRTGK